MVCFYRTTIPFGGVDVTKNNGENVRFVSFYNDKTQSENSFKIDGHGRMVRFSELSEAIRKMNNKR